MITTILLLLLVMLCGAGLGSLAAEAVSIEEVRQVTRKVIKYLHETYLELKRYW